MDMRTPEGAHVVLQAGDIQMPPQAAPIVNVTVEPTPVQVDVTNQVPAAPPTPVQVTAMPGECVVRNEVTVKAELPPARPRKAVIDGPDGKTEITIRPAS